MELKDSILDMNPEEFFEFFIKDKNYCSINLPSYFSFRKLLLKARDYMLEKHLTVINEFKNPSHSLLFSKKDNKTCRKLEIINPLLYVGLLNTITLPSNFYAIKSNFIEYSKNKKIRCFSIPLKLNYLEKEGPIPSLWSIMEQEALEMYNEYTYFYYTDIKDFYQSIPIKFIPYTLYGSEALDYNTTYLYLKYMNGGKEIGIPQGSVLMDVLSESILGYIDNLLTKALEKEKLHNYTILRYRDDYRIFVNKKEDGETILNLLSKILSSLKLSLNKEKTKGPNHPIEPPIIDNRYQWILKMKYISDVQKKLLLLHNFTMNCQSSIKVLPELINLYKDIYREKVIENSEVLIKLVSDLAFMNIKTVPISFALISRFLNFINPKSKKIEILKNIHTRFMKLPTLNFIEIWLQRISYPINKNLEYDEKLCRIVKGEDIDLWGINHLFNVPIVNKYNLFLLRDLVDPEELNLSIDYYD